MFVPSAVSTTLICLQLQYLGEPRVHWRSTARPSILIFSTPEPGESWWKSPMVRNTIFPQEKSSSELISSRASSLLFQRQRPHANPLDSSSQAKTNGRPRCPILLRRDNLGALRGHLGYSTPQQRSEWRRNRSTNRDEASITGERGQDVASASADGLTGPLEMEAPKSFSVTR